MTPGTFFASLTGEAFSDVIAAQGDLKMSAPERIHTSSGVVYDSACRYSLMLRAGHIFVCSAPNCGTTCTRKLRALLVHQGATLPRLSRWLDCLAQPNTGLTRCRDVPM